MVFVKWIVLAGLQSHFQNLSGRYFLEKLRQDLCLCWNKRFKQKFWQILYVVILLQMLSYCFGYVCFIRQRLLAVNSDSKETLMSKLSLERFLFKSWTVPWWFLSNYCLGWLQNHFPNLSGCHFWEKLGQDLCLRWNKSLNQKFGQILNAVFLLKM